MNLPNRLTLLRCVLAPLILIFMLPASIFGANHPWNLFIHNYGMIVAFCIFVIASLTDMLDGHIARKQNLITNFGKFLDPIADKILVLSVFIAFVALGELHAIVPIVVLFREFVVTGIRLMAIEHGQVIAASQLGKAKTVSQIIAILLMMLKHIILRYVDCQSLEALASLMVLVCVILTILSGFDYWKKSNLSLK